MKGLPLRALAAFLAVLSLAGRRADRSVPESLTPFSEIERLFVRGAVVVCAIVGIWFITVLVRGRLEDRRRARENKELVNPQFARPASPSDKAQNPPPRV